MTKRGYIRLFSYAFALVAVLGIYAIVNMNNANNYKMQLENSYQQSLNELSETLDSIETNLTKSVYSNSDDMLFEISSDLYSECTKAKDALSRLPVSQMNLSTTYKFISQASDYANYIAQKVASGETLTNEEHKNLSTLLNYAQQLNDNVSSMVSICNSGGKITASNIKSGAVKVSALSNNMTTAENAFKDYPTLLYDGPFADAVLNRKSKLLEKSDECTADEAKKIAATALYCDANQLTQNDDEEGNMPCYVFTYCQNTIGVTKAGGYIAYILYGGKISSVTISEDNAINLAEKYLEKIGYENMSPTYSMVSNNTCVINFAYEKNGITYYSELIKVGVSLDDGTVVSLEATGYLTNHIERNKQTPKMKQADVQKNLSSYLNVLDAKLCVIPKEDGTEAFCYEFHCESKETGEEVLIYANANTGVEENILLLLYSDGGTLTK